MACPCKANRPKDAVTSANMQTTGPDAAQRQYDENVARRRADEAAAAANAR
jgi:hypothetical protein